ncbi:MAG: TrkA family potassium uptake protein [Deltaproteobacteria bacterium]|nr:TrkA family potassium uptake protein [Deltaproteobacteria bacterium]MBW2072579.1 TrkA family potassium uptake protein [Deltaproteobacteria bacterium]
MGQFAIIGIGNFGFYLGRQLYVKGHEVIALDISKGQIQKVKDFVTQAIVADATDRETLESLGLRDVDAAVVCIGTRMQAAILATLHLKELGVRRILAKATSEEQGRILRKIGADEILFPERDLALGVAGRLDNPNMLDYLPFVEGYSIAELKTPPHFVNKTLKDLDLTNRFGVQVLAVKEASRGITLIPTAGFQVKDGDKLIVLGPEKKLKSLQKE